MWVEDKQLWLNRAERRMLLGYRKPNSANWFGYGGNARVKGSR